MTALKAFKRKTAFECGAVTNQMEDRTKIAIQVTSLPWRCLFPSGTIGVQPYYLTEGHH